MATQRQIALIDMDAFYVQVETFLFPHSPPSQPVMMLEVEMRDRPELKGKPVAVVQYNQVRRGGLIAVGYEARAAGVKRSMRADEALKVCPGLNLVSTPTTRHKVSRPRLQSGFFERAKGLQADLTKYRKASAEVFAVLNAFQPEALVVEKASIDEAYLDLSKVPIDRSKQQGKEGVSQAVEEALSEVGLDGEVAVPERLPSTFVLSTHLAAAEAEREARLGEWLARAAQEVTHLSLGPLGWAG